MNDSINEKAAPRVAIIGMSCRFPGAPDHASYWQNLRDGICSVSEIPPERWSIDEYYSTDPEAEDRSVSKWGGFIQHHDCFDAAYFGISPREAHCLDPQQRVLLESVAACFEDAGYSAKSLSGSRTAVYVGASLTDHWPYVQQSRRPISAHWAVGMALSIIANRISYQFNLSGPSMTLDTACSSSLVALHHGVQALRNGESTLAVVAGVSLMTMPTHFSSFSKMGMLSPEGRCRTFDEKASGYVRSEGVGVVLLKLEEQALADGDRILGIVCGSAINHGGHARTLTAPNAFAQARVIVDAHTAAAVPPDSISYIEAHGTGTPVGDPIEILGLKRAFARLAEQSGATLPEAACAIGSAKTNLGHLEPAAGMAGLIKVLLSFQHQELPPLIHFEQLNSRITLAGSPFHIADRLQPWQPAHRPDGTPYPRRAGVSCFGFGGTNVHTVLEEPPPTAARELRPQPAYLVALSGRTPEALAERVQQLHRHCEAAAADRLELADLSFTLLAGRDHWEHRLAWVVASREELRDTLRRCAEGNPPVAVFRGGPGDEAAAARPQAEKDAKAFLETLSNHGIPGEDLFRPGLSTLAQAYAAGCDLDWTALFAGSGARRVALPTYPFARRRHSVYLMPAKADHAPAPEADAAPVPAPAPAPAAAPLPLPENTAAPSPAAPPARRKVQLASLGAVAPRAVTAVRPESLRTLAPLTPTAAATPPPPAPAAARTVAPAVAPTIAEPAAAPTPGAALATPPPPAAAVVPDVDLVPQLRQSLAAALYITAEEVDVARPFVEQGLDSVIGVEWMRGINSQFKLAIPVTKLYDHPTILALAKFLGEALTARSAASLPAATPPAAPAGTPAPEPAPAPAPEAPAAAAPPPSPAIPHATILQVLRESLAKALYLEASELREHLPFVDLGLDSVVGVEWIRAINKHFGLALQATRLYDHPTLQALATYIGSELAGRQAAAPQPPAAPPAPAAPAPAQTAAPARAVAAPPARTAAELPQEPYGLALTTVHTLEELAMRPWHLPAPQPAEVTVQVHASAVNFPDLLCVQGLYPTMPSYPFVPGFEVAGVITAVGSEVQGWRVGDAVITVTGSALGGHASQVNVPASHLIRKPAGMSHEDACSLPVIFSTVYHAFQLARLQPREHVLIQTATGGCGLAALQWAWLNQSICYGTSSREDKLALLRRLGVEHTLNYRTAEFDREVHRLTAGRGVDVVLNMLSGEAIQGGLNSLAPGGRYLELAVHALRTSQRLDLSRLVQNQAIHSIDLRRLALSGDQTFGDLFAPLLPLFESGRLVPVVSRIYPAAEIVEALRYVATGGHIGKVVISHTATAMVDCTERCIDALLAQRDLALRSPLTAAARAPQIAALPQPAAPAPETADAIAVVGMAGRFPGARNLDEFWANLVQGKDSVTEVPAGRWPWPAHFDPQERVPGKTYSRWMGAIDGVEEFDPLFFSIAPAEARLMDPEQRLILQSVWHCFEDAGIRPSTVSGSRCGVFVGCASGDYGLMLGADRLTAQGLMGGAASILSGRIAYLFNLQGPCLSIDTACSSALVAVAEACASLAAGHCETALAGGAYVMAGPSMHIMTSQAGMLSKRGRCSTFDQQADGFVPSEGVGVVLLKRLADARRDGDRVYGVIKGWGIKQDGKTNGITAPSANSQTALEREVYDRFAINPEHITLVEAHGTGTKLGDPIEVEALTQAFRTYTPKKQFSAIGSVKSNIGHGMTSAGIAGLMKVMLCLRHRKLVPTLHYAQPNEHIPFADSPFFVNTEYRDWPAGTAPARMAALSSFGFSGTNVHVVMAEAPAEPTRPMGGHGPALVVLSAKDEERLHEAVLQLHARLAARDDWRLADVAYTLQVGREPMPVRAAFPAASREDLLGQLAAWAAGKPAPATVTSAHAPADTRLATLMTTDADARQLIQVWLRKQALDKVAELWVHGFEPDWNLLYEGSRPQRISLPGYSFARERLWALDTVPAATWQSDLRAAQRRLAAPGEAHPLLGEPVSRFGVSGFSASFCGDEPFLAHHQVRGQRVLPAAAQLEMALAAAQRLAGPARPVVLQNLAWKRLARVAAGRTPPLQLSIEFERRDGQAIEFRVYESQENDLRKVCSSGAVLVAPTAGVPARLNLPALQAACSHGVLEAAACYAAFTAVELDYGPAHRCLERVYRGPDQALARLLLPAEFQSDLAVYRLPPGLLDCALQATIGVLAQADGHLDTLALPQALGSLEVFGPCEARMWASVRRIPATERPGAHVFDIDLCDDGGEVRVRLNGFVLQPMQAGKRPAAVPALAADGQVRLLGREWEPAPAAAAPLVAPAAGRRVVVLCELDGIDRSALAHTLGGGECIGLERGQGDLAERFQAHAARLLELLQSLFQRSGGQAMLLQLVYPASAEAGGFEGLAAMLKAARQENPQFSWQALGVEPGVDTATMASRLQAEGADTEVRYLAGVRQQPAWRVLPAAPASAPWKPGGIYLITGGAGGMGLVFAADIVQKAPGAHVVLIGRSPLTEAQRARMREFWMHAGSVEYRRVDVSSRAAIGELIDSIVADHGRLDGILHAAGVLRDAFIRAKTAADVPAVLAPKVRGLVNLDEASAGLPLDFFVAFSSLSGSIGNAGQADYAAANAFLDSFTVQRDRLVRQGRRAGRTVAIAWPLWNAGGMAVDAVTAERIRQRIGAIDDAQGLAFFYGALAQEAAHIAVTSASAELLAGHRPQPATPAAEAPGAAEVDRTRVTDYVIQLLSRVLKVPAERWKPTSRFEQFGIDSILQASILQEMEGTLGELPKTLLFEYATVQELVDYLATQHARHWTARPAAAPAVSPIPAPALPLSLPVAAAEPPRPVAAVAAAPVAAARHPAPARDDIAIIGISGRYPGAASLDELWQRLREGSNCITRAPADRWSSAGQPAAEHYGGFLQRIDRFDHRLFGIAPDDVPRLTPELRLMLETVWLTFEDAGYSLARLRALQEGALGVGVYVGSMYNQSAWAQGSVEAALAASNESEWQLANRISHFFDLRGPSLAVNTACSSSMTAIHLACESLRQGGCAMAIAGGVNLTLEPTKYRRLQEAKFLDNGPRSRSFGEGEGYVPGEGVGAVLLKPLAQAERDGDRILGVIRSSVATHSGGRQKYTVPDPRRQAELIELSLRQAGVDPATITCVESAANGSPLGDPIEVVALRNVFERATPQRGFCALGSVKSNLGHLEAASGISQLSKVLLQFQHQTLVPTLHAEPVNRAIQLDGSAFQLQRQTQPWHRLADPASGADLPLRAMINSFGAGGSYCNLIVEEYRGAMAPADDAATDRPFVVSAMSEASLRRRIADLQRYVEARPGLSLLDLAASLARVNNDLPQRAAVVAATREQLLAALGRLASGSERYAGPADSAAAPVLRAWADSDAPLPDDPAVRLPAGRPCLALPGYPFDHGPATPAPADDLPGTPVDQILQAIFQRVANGELTQAAAWKLVQETEE